MTQKLKEEAEKLQQEFGYCVLDGRREKIGNFRTEPPGLFRGRGDHPKMGMLKRRVMPEDVVINCSRYVGVSLPDSPGGALEPTLPTEVTFVLTSFRVGPFTGWVTEGTRLYIRVSWVLSEL